MGRRITGITVERQLVTVPVAGPVGCATDMECVQCGSGSGSGSGSGGQCVVDCDQCPDGSSETWTLAAPGAEGGVTLTHVDAPDDGNYCTFVSDDLDWRLQYDYGADAWVLEQFSTGYLWALSQADWDCLGTNIMVSDDPAIDDAVVTPDEDCHDISYDCVDGSCVSVAGTGGTYATLVECLAACGGGTVVVPCCVEPIPTLLTVTVTNRSDTCACLPDSFQIAWNGSAWIAHIEACAEVRLQCNGSGPTWSFTGLGVVASWNAAGAATTCSPFRISFTGVTFSMPGSCTGTADFAIAP